MQVDVYTGTKEDWNAFTAGNGGGILQSFEWGEFRTELGWKNHRFTVTDGKTVFLQALVLQKPMPGGYCFFYTPEGPVVRGGDWQDLKNQQAFAALHELLKTRAKNEKALFLKVDPHRAAETFPVPWLDGLGFNDSPEDIQAAVVAHVDLAGSEDDVLARMKQKGRYNIRYADKKGVTVRRGHSQQDLDDFYALLEPTAKRQGITHRNKDYYTAFRKYFMEHADQATFITADYNGQPVASILVTFMGDEAIYLYGGSSDADRNVYGSYAVQWAGMQEAMKRGCTLYNMTGVADTDDPNNAWAGLRQFKLKFGADVVHLLGARDFVYQPLLYKAFTTADKVRRRIAKRTGH